MRRLEIGKWCQGKVFLNAREGVKGSCIHARAPSGFIRPPVGMRKQIGPEGEKATLKRPNGVHGAPSGGGIEKNALAVPALPERWAALPDHRVGTTKLFRRKSEKGTQSLLLERSEPHRSGLPTTAPPASPAGKK